MPSMEEGVDGRISAGRSRAGGRSAAPAWHQRLFRICTSPSRRIENRYGTGRFAYVQNELTWVKIFVMDLLAI